MPDSAPITHLLHRLRGGDEDASGELFELVYDELRAVAGKVFAGRPVHATMQPTALVGAAWMKLAGNLDAARDRLHFYAIAAKAMRQVLADEARARRTQKRGEGRRALTLLGDIKLTDADDLDVVELDEVLTKLKTLNERHAAVVELRFLCGLTVNETAQALEISTDTVKHDWATARAWLGNELRSA